MGLWFSCSLSIDQPLSSIPQNVIYLSLVHSILNSELVFFHNFKFLLFLDLSYTRLGNTELCRTGGVYGADCQIRILSLSHNNLHEINSHCFPRLFELKNLILQGNFIHKIRSYSFQNLSSLHLLNLSSLQITKLHLLSFKNNSAIAIIDLSYNKLLTIAMTTFNVLPALKVLILVENNLNSILMCGLNIQMMITSQFRICKCVVRQRFPCAIIRYSSDCRSCDLVSGFKWLPFKEKTLGFLCAVVVFENVCVYLLRKFTGESMFVLLFLVFTNIIGVILIVMALFLNSYYENILQTADWLDTYICKILGVAFSQVLFLSFLCITLFSINKTIAVKIPFRRKGLSGRNNKAAIVIINILYLILNITLSTIITYHCRGSVNLCVPFMQKYSDDVLSAVLKLVILSCFIFLLLLQFFCDAFMLSSFYYGAGRIRLVSNQKNDKLLAALKRNILRTIYNVFIFICLSIAFFTDIPGHKTFLIVSFFGNAIFHPGLFIYSLISVSSFKEKICLTK